MKKVILFTALAAGTIVGAAAQEPIKFGARAGLNFDSQKLSIDNKSETSKNKVGFHIGGVADIPLVNFVSTLPSWIYFQPGVYITTKGGKEEKTENHGGISISYTGTASLYYLELPLLASVKFSVTDEIGVRVHFGPSVGLALSGKTKVEGSGGGQNLSEEKSYKFNKDDNMSRGFFGLDFGGGVEYKQFYLGLGYDLGLSNMYTGSGNDSVKNRTFSISLGYNF